MQEQVKKIEIGSEKLPFILGVYVSRINQEGEKEVLTIQTRQLLEIKMFARAPMPERKKLPHILKPDRNPQAQEKYGA